MTTAAEAHDAVRAGHRPRIPACPACGFAHRHSPPRGRHWLCHSFDDEHHRFAMLNLAAVQPEGAAPPPVQPRSLVGVDHIAYIAGTPVAELLRRETAEPMSPIRGELAAYA